MRRRVLWMVMVALAVGACVSEIKAQSVPNPDRANAIKAQLAQFGAPTASCHQTTGFLLTARGVWRNWLRCMTGFPLRQRNRMPAERSQAPWLTMMTVPA